MECEDAANSSMEAVARPHDELDYEDDLPQQANQQISPEPDSSPVEETKDDEIEEGEVEDEPVTTMANKKPCYFFKIGKCTWGRQCKFLHPSTSDTGAYQLIPDRNNTTIIAKETIVADKADINNGLSSETSRWVPEAVYPRTAAESAWEEGLRHARQMRQRAEQRRRQDKDFADKRLNLRVKDIREGVEEQDEEVVIARKARTDIPRPNVNKFCPSSILSVRGSIPRDRSMSLEFDSRHGTFYDYKSKGSHMHHRSSRSSPRRQLFRKEYKTSSIYDADAEWHDPWSRRPSNRRNRAPSTDSSSTGSISCSSSRSISSYSSRSSYTTSRSCSSGSSRRYCRRRRSPSVKRSRPSTPSTLRSVVVPPSRDRKDSSLRTSPKPTEEPTNVQPFKPGRQISSHTLKKAEREGKLEDASQFSSDEDCSSRVSSRDSSPLSFSSTESSSCQSSDILVPTTIGAQAAATRLENSRLRQKPAEDTTPVNVNNDSSTTVANQVEEISDNTVNTKQNQTNQRHKTNEEKTALLRQLKEIEEEIAKKRKHKK